MAKVNFIFTTDYELFGNGTGCVEKCMIEPTERMAFVLEQAGAPLTIFFDVCEYWAFEAEFAKGSLKVDWAGMIREQLQDLTRRGHDVQLHFHPQWLDYSFDGKKWSLNYDLWRIGKLLYEDVEFPERGLKALFFRGKQALEEIIREVKLDYSCEVFRAGAWSIQPEELVLKALRANGFRVDSTVAPGLAFEDSHTYYDFGAAPSRSFSYRVSSDNINKEVKNGDFWEVPIFTCEAPFLRKVYFLALKKIKGLEMKPKGCKGTTLSTAGKTKLQKIKEAILQNRSMFNYSDATSYEEMIYFAQQALKRYAGHEEDLVPVVAISHPKTFGNEKEFRKFILWLKNRDDIQFGKYKDILNKEFK